MHEKYYLSTIRNYFYKFKDNCFAEESNDLTYLSIADLSVMALAYETIKKINKLDKLNKKPLSFNIVSQDKLIKEANKKQNEKKKEN